VLLVAGVRCEMAGIYQLLPSCEYWYLPSSGPVHFDLYTKFIEFRPGMRYLWRLFIGVLLRDS
ncbi:MAG: hypothetical protein WBW34_01140, partial [Nitrososphaeraceae archaeon]